MAFVPYSAGLLNPLFGDFPVDEPELFVEIGDNVDLDYMEDDNTYSIIVSDACYDKYFELSGLTENIMKAMFRSWMEAE